MGEPHPGVAAFGVSAGNELLLFLTHWPGRVWNCCGIPGIQCRLRNVCLKNQVSAVEMGFVITFKSELFFN